MRYERAILKTTEILLFVVGAVCMASGVALAALTVVG
jgi:hypothetical protein